MKGLLFNLIFFLVLSSCSSQSLIPISLNGKTGYLNQNLEIVISPQFEYGSIFVDNYAIVKKSGSFLIIDNAGKVIYSTKSENLIHLGGDFFIELNDLYRIINIRTNEVIASDLRLVQYDGSGFTNIIAVDFYGVDEEVFYINNTGDFLFQNTPIIGGYSFNNGIATVLTDEWYFTLMDTEGNLKDVKFRRLGKYFSEGLCPAQTFDGKTGYIDTDGNFVFEIPLVVSNEMGYENTPFEDGRSIINCYGDEQYWIVIDIEGNYISKKIRADNCYGFQDGMSVIHKYINGEHTYGYVNNAGEIIFDYIFSSVKEFSNGYAQVITQNGIEGIVDKSGNVYYSRDLLK